MKTRVLRSRGSHGSRPSPGPPCATLAIAFSSGSPRVWSSGRAYRLAQPRSVLPYHPDPRVRDFSFAPQVHQRAEPGTAEIKRKKREPPTWGDSARAALTAGGGWAMVPSPDSSGGAPGERPGVRSGGRVAGQG